MRQRTERIPFFCTDRTGCALWRLRFDIGYNDQKGFSIAGDIASYDEVLEGFISNYHRLQPLGIGERYHRNPHKCKHMEAYQAAEESLLAEARDLDPDPEAYMDSYGVGDVWVPEMMKALDLEGAHDGSVQYLDATNYPLASGWVSDPMTLPRGSHRR